MYFMLQPLALTLGYLRNLETVRLILMQVNEDLSGFDLVP
jgi:hypothetical protein